MNITNTLKPETENNDSKDNPTSQMQTFIDRLQQRPHSELHSEPLQVIHPFPLPQVSTPDPTAHLKTQDIESSTNS